MSLFTPNLRPMNASSKMCFCPGFRSLIFAYIIHACQKFSFKTLEKIINLSETFLGRKLGFKHIFPLFIFGLSVFIFQGCERVERVEVKRKKIDDVELAYYIRGQGEPLVMVMGFRGTMAIWDPGLLEILEKKYTLILFDNRGVGLSSEADAGALTIEQMADDTAKLVQACGYQEVHVLGWSMGSRIALELALRYPKMVTSLILCSPNPGGKYQVPRKTKAYGELIAKDVSPKEGLSLIFPDTSEGNKASESFVARLKAAILKGTVPDDLTISDQAVEQQVHALKLWDENSHIYAALSTIQKPTLVAGGLADVLDQPDNVRIVACQIPFAWTAYFPGAGHNFLSQDYRDFATLVTLFIETNQTQNKK